MEQLHPTSLVELILKICFSYPSKRIVWELIDERLRRNKECDIFFGSRNEANEKNNGRYVNVT